MSTQNSAFLTIDQAQKILQPFNCVESKSVNSESEKASIRQALLLLAEHSDFQILGICADTATQGLLALKHYAQALGYQPPLGLEPIDGSIYIKFNPKNGISYLDSYTGTHRGVLVSFQSAYEDGVNDMYGHLPLDLFD
ncbi:MAG TPA: DUF1824 family protein [Waterburya sp.]|jgi:hypothetical protein